MAKLTSAILSDLIVLSASMSEKDMVAMLGVLNLKQEDDPGADAVYCPICHDWDCGGHGV